MKIEGPVQHVPHRKGSTGQEAIDCMNKQEQERLFIIAAKLQALRTLIDDLEERLTASGETGDFAERLGEICRDVDDLAGNADASQETALRYDLNRIVRERLIRGWTQQMLANNSKLHRATVSAILKRGRGSPKKIQALANAVGLELEDLIVDE